MSICQRERWLAMIARSDDEVVIAPLGEAALTDAQVDLICDTVSARLRRRHPSRDRRGQRAERGPGKRAQREHRKDQPIVATALARLGLSPDQVAVLSAAIRLDESAMAVVTVIDHGVKPARAPRRDLGRRLRPRSHHDQLQHRTGRHTVDEHLAHLPRRAATGPGQLAQRGEGAGLAVRVISASANSNKCADEGLLRFPNPHLDGAGPASKVLTHGFEFGQRTPGVGALFLEPAKCRRAVASRCADGVRSGAAPARVADSRLCLRTPRGRVDVRVVLVQARRPGRTVDDPGRPGHRRGLRTRRRPAASRAESDQRAA